MTKFYNINITSSTIDEALSFLSFLAMVYYLNQHMLENGISAGVISLLFMLQVVNYNIKKVLKLREDNND